MSSRVCCCKLSRPVSFFRQRFISTAQSSNAGKETHFGYQKVLEEEKEGKVYSVFHNVAEKYDLMNDVMSGGVHRLWKDQFMRRFSPTPGTRLIDVAGGTGDIAFRFLNFTKSKTHNIADSSSFDIEIPPDVSASIYGNTDLENEASDDSQCAGKRTHVTVCDINQAMLDVGKIRATNMGLQSADISWLKGNAECLPVSDNQYDAYTIAYGIRNVTHIDKVLLEAYRVLKPGGRFLCLEFSEVSNPIFRRIYDEYSFQVIPVMGKVVAGDWHSYQYLVESIRQFPNQKTFAAMIRQAGFRAVSYKNLMMGVSAIHSGFKI